MRNVKGSKKKFFSALTLILILFSFFKSEAQPGVAINCDGVNDYIDPNTLVTTISNNFTFEFWARPTATHEIDVESTISIDGISGQRFLLWPTWRGSNGGIGVSVGTNGISVYEHGSNFIPSLCSWSGTLSGWTHIAISIINKQPYIYVNGVLVKVGQTSTHTNVYPSLGACGQYPGQVGGFGGGSYGYYQGEIDEFRLWGYVRTLAQIQGNMNMELSCNNGTYAYYRFNNGTASSANNTVTSTQDLSGNNFTASLYNFALVGATSNWISPGGVVPGSGVTGIGLSSPNVCPGGSATLTLLGSSTGSWSTGGIGSTIVVTPSVTTVYSVAVASGTCNASAQTTVTISQPQPIVISQSQSSFCPGTQLTITASGASTYTWNTLQVSPSLAVSPNVTTVYTVSGSSINGCGGVSSITLTPVPNPVISLVCTPSVLCIGSQATITASGASTYTWSALSNSSSIAVSPSITSTYIVAGTGTNGCSNVASVTISPVPNPVVLVSYTPSVICAGAQVTLIASGASTYSWNSLGNSASVVVSPTASSVYMVTGYDANGCNSVAFATLNPLANPVINVSYTPSVICAGTQATVTATGASTYSWNTTAASPSILVNPTSLTGYTVTGYDANGCSGIGSATINPAPNPTITAVCNPSLVCTGSSYTLTAGGAVNYTWSSGSGNFTITGTAPATATVYSVTGANAQGCKKTATVNINVRNCTSVSESWSEDTFLVWPNPVNDKLQVMVWGALKNASLFDVTGKKLAEVDEPAMSASNQLTFDMSGYSRGIYFISITAQGKTKTLRLIKE